MNPIDLIPHFKSTRGKVAWALAMMTGLRSIELVRLRVCDINLTDSTVMVWGKYRKGYDEQITISKECNLLLRSVINSNNLTGFDYIFKGRGRGKGKHASTRTLRQWIEDARKSANCYTRFHLMRHDAAKRMYLKNGLHATQRHLRHWNKITTLTYLLS